jgi:hypothetical protein
LIIHWNVLSRGRFLDHPVVENVEVFSAKNKTRKKERKREREREEREGGGEEKEIKKNDPHMYAEGTYFLSGGVNVDPLVPLPHTHTRTYTTML